MFERKDHCQEGIAEGIVYFDGQGPCSRECHL